MTNFDQTSFLQSAQDDPISLDNYFAVQAGGVLSVSIPGVLGNDIDLGGGDLGVVLISNTVDNGELSAFPNGRFNYTPEPGFAGVDSFTYRVRDEDGNTSSATVHITVYENPAPLAFNETYSVLEDGSLTVPVPKGLLLNDVDPDGTDLDVILISNTVDDGDLSAFTGGNFTYTPDPGFVGNDSFSYRIRDEDGNTATATATINVIENEAPLAFGETYVVKEGASLSISAPGILQNDIDAAGEDLDVILISNTVDDGSLSAFSGGNFTYTPDEGFSGTDSFTYRIRDEGGKTATATANIVVVPDLAPLARDETYAVAAGTELIIGTVNGLLANDVDPEGTDLDVILISNTVDNGSLSAFSGGNFSYTPDPGFVGTDSFTYRIRDEFGNTATATTTIEVLANPGVEAFDEAYVVLEGDELVVDAANGLLKNDIDTDGGDLDVILITDGVENGSLSAFSGGNFRYTPNDGFVGTDSFTYRVRDSDGNTATATATITVGERADPIAVNEGYTFRGFGSLSVSAADGLLANDVDPAGTDLNVVLITNGVDNGSLSAFSGGNFTYTPSPGFVGTDSFTYRIRNENGDTDTATATILVGSIRVATPLAAPDFYQIKPGETLSVNTADGLLQNDDSAFGGALSVTLITNTVDNGTLSAFSGGNFTYTPDPGFIGTDSFTYRIQNQQGQSAIGTATIEVAPTLDPLAGDDSYTVLRNGTLTIAADQGLLVNDLDPEGTDLSVVLITDTVDNGSLSAFTGGNFTYTPDANFVGTDSFTYRVRDEDGDFSTATVTLNVVAPAAPVATNDSYAVEPGTELIVDAEAGLLANDFDQQGDDLSVVLITDTVDNGSLSAFSGGNFRYTPNPGFSGVDSFTYRIRDEDGATATATVSLHVRESAAPVANDDSYTVLRNGTLTIAAAQGLLANDLDPEGTDLSVVLISDTVDNGSLSAFTGGNFTYTPDPNFVGTDSFTYRVRDEDGVTSTATATINVVAPTPPVATDDNYSTFADAPLVIGVDQGLLANDFDQTGQDLDVILITNGVNNGSLSAFSGGNFNYTPNPGFVGTDSFTYRIRDEDGATASATATINVVARPEPIAVDDLFSVEANQTLTIDIESGLLANDVDPAGTDLDVILISNTVDNGSLSAFTGGNFTYTPDPGFTGYDSFTYRVRNEFGDTDTATVHIAVTAPDFVLPFLDILAFQPRSELVLDVLANDQGALPGTFEIVSFTEAKNGELFERDGKIIYQPDFGFAGTEAFSYEIQNEAGQTQTIFARIDIEAPNIIQGTGGSDNLIGTENADRFLGEGGPYDRFLGGEGADQFVFGDETNDGARSRTLVSDFDGSEDYIVLTDGAEILNISQRGSAITVIFEGDRDTLYLRGSNLDADSLQIEVIDADEFLF